MKWTEALKKMGIDLESEMDETSIQTLDLKSKDVLKEEAEKKKDTSNTININVTGAEKKEDIQKEQEDTEVVDYSKIKFDETSGLFDLNTVDDAGLKAILELSNNTVVKTANNVKINDAFNKKMSDVKLHKGITVDAVRSLINMTDVKVDKDGKVTGLDEAFETLKKEQSGLFVQRGAGENSPALEGYNPAGGINAGSNNNTGGISDAELMALSTALKGD